MKFSHILMLSRSGLLASAVPRGYSQVGWEASVRQMCTLRSKDCLMGFLCHQELLQISDAGALPFLVIEKVLSEFDFVKEAQT